MTRTISIGVIIGLGILSVLASATAVAQERDAVSELHGRVYSLEQRVDRLDSRPELGWSCGVVLLFGSFCALWAQNTGRNAWFCFFMGALFSGITVLVLLTTNAKDLAAKATLPEPPPESASVGTDSAKPGVP